MVEWLPFLLPTAESLHSNLEQKATYTSRRYSSLWKLVYRLKATHCRLVEELASSIPVKVIFQLTQSFQPHYGPGSTQPLTVMSTRNLPGGKRRPVRKADNLTAVWRADCPDNMRSSTFHNPTGSTALPFYLTIATMYSYRYICSECCPNHTQTNFYLMA
jgi:hypothetical protein